MEKISGIIPVSARTRTAEVSSLAARPGAPSMGRSEGRNSLGDRLTLSKQFEELKSSGQIPEFESAPIYKPSPENNKLKVIADINEKFFAGSPKPTAKTAAPEGPSEALFFVEKELQPQKSEAVQT